MTKLKKIIKNNWMYAVVYGFGLLLTILAGWLLGKPNMLNATAFSGSSITYNENQLLKSTDDTYTATIISGNSKYAISLNSTSNIINLANGTLSGNVITFANSYWVYPGQSSNITNNTLWTTPTLTINSDNAVLAYTSFGFNNTYTFNIYSAGYSESQYIAYGQQQYNAGYSAGVAYVQAHPSEYNLYTSAQYSANYTAGQNSVINSPNTYGLYTQAQYEANYTSGYNAGIAYVQANPSQYNLYTASQYTDYGTSQYNAGVQYVIDHPSNYNLYTQNQYNSYGSDQYNAGQTAVITNPNYYSLYTASQMYDQYVAGQNLILNNPNDYGLYTLAQYNAHAQEQYDAGYLAGQQSSTNYQDGIQYVLDHPAEYNLYTTTQYNAYGTAQYTAGQNAVINDPNTYGLYNQVQMETAEQNSYSDGYQDGIEQGENNVISNPNDYDLYTENQYINNSSYSDFLLNQIASVWVNQPVYDDNTGYWMSHWVKVNNNLLNVNENTIDYSNIYSNYSNITDIEVYYKSYFTNDLPLYVANITDPQYYTNIQVDIACYITTPSTAHNLLDNNCQVVPYTQQLGWANSIIVDYSRLINNTNYFDAIEWGSTASIDHSYMKYNCIRLHSWSVVGDPMIYLNSNINSVTYDISSLNLSSYNIGYQSGYSIGQKDNNKAEYNRGFNDGYDRAEELYAETDGTGNTLTGLAGTILFSPVQMLKTIFNFEILGVNLAGFILSIITLIIVIWLIKRLL